MILPTHIRDWDTYWRELYEERAGILEFEANCSRPDAERIAEFMVRKQATDMPRKVN